MTKHLVRFSTKINNLMICVYMHMMMCHSIKSVTYCIGYIQPNDTISLKFIFFCTKLFTLVNMIWIAINKNIWLVIKTMAVHVDNVVYCLLIYQQIVTINYCPSKNKTFSRKDENFALIAVIYIWNMFSNVKMIKSVSIRIQNAEVIKFVLFTNRSYRPLTR